MPKVEALTTADRMSVLIRTHDAWGVVVVGEFASLEEGQRVFAELCQDPWYRQDGTVKGVELVQRTPFGSEERLQWFAF